MRTARPIYAAMILLSCLGSSPAQQSLPAPADLHFPPLSEIAVPKPTMFVLPNGLKIFLLENHDLPVVRGTMLVRTGNLFDPKEKRGLARLTGITLRSGGTKDLSGSQLDEKLESMAATIETEINESTGIARFHCLAEDAGQVLPLFYDVVTAPVFSQDQIDLAKTQLESGISRRNDDAPGIASRELFRQIYGRETPYGWMQEYSTLNAITRDDIASFYKRYFFPSNTLLSVYGDFATAEMKEKLQKLFGSWSATQEKVAPFPRVASSGRPGIFEIEDPDINQTFIEMGELGGEYRDKDFAALSIAVDVFGGGFSSRLMREVRSRMGYAYDVEAEWEADFDHPGIFRITCGTRSEQTAETIRAILRQLDDFTAGEIGDQELRTAKEGALNRFVFSFERPSNTLERLMIYDYFGYPEDFLARYQAAIRAVTKADVLRVAKHYFVGRRLTIVAVGNQRNFGESLETLKFPVKQLDITIPPPARENALR